MARIIGIGDVHEHPGPRNADRWRAVDQIIDEGLTVGHLGAWVVAGDLFDTKSTTDGRNAWDQRLQRMAGVAPVIVCYGNHDEKGDLDGFARLAGTWPIYVYDAPHVAVIRLATGEAAGVFVLPYPHKGGLVSAGVAPGDVVATGADLLDPIFITAAAQLTHLRETGHLTFMVGHANIVGSIASTGQPQWGREIEVSQPHLDRLGPILKLFGHIHKPQEIAGAVYLGSVCRLDYGEIEAKRYVVADIAPDSSYTLESRPIAIAPMFHVTARVDPTGFYLPDGCDEEIARRCCARDWTGCDVRVRYTYKASEKAALPSEDAIREHFTGALRLKLEGVAVVDRDVRSPEVAAAKTLPEKLAAYRHVAQLEPSVASKVDALQQQSDEQLLVDVAAALADVERPREASVAA